MAELQNKPLNADYNLCNRSREEQDYESAKTLAHFWLHQKRYGKMTRQDINKRLNAMTEPQRELQRKALNEAIQQRKQGNNHGA